MISSALVETCDPSTSNESLTGKRKGYADCMVLDSFPPEDLILSYRVSDVVNHIER